MESVSKVFNVYAGDDSIVASFDNFGDAIDYAESVKLDYYFVSTPAMKAELDALKMVAA